MSIAIRGMIVVLALALVTSPAHASLYSLSASGTITVNTSGDPAIPVGAPWSFDLTYDTAAPDLDFQTTGTPTPTYGKYTNTAVPPALTSFHYQAGSYQVTLSDPAGFVPTSEILITFMSVNAIDINIFAPAFPMLAGNPVSFHADFNAVTMAPIFTSDGLPTNTALSAASFDQSTISLLPIGGEVSGSLTSFTVAAVPEPAAGGLCIAGVLVLIDRSRHSA